jgi:hypothetical protein
MASSCGSNSYDYLMLSDDMGEALERWANHIEKLVGCGAAAMNRTDVECGAFCQNNKRGIAGVSQSNWWSMASGSVDIAIEHGGHRDDSGWSMVATGPLRYGVLIKGARPPARKQTKSMSTFGV